MNPVQIATVTYLYGAPDPPRNEPLGDDIPQAPLSFGDDGGTYGGMEARVTALEQQHRDVVAKLDRIGDKIDGVAIDIAEVKGRLTSLPQTIAADVAALKARVDALPTTKTFSVILAIAAALYAFAPQLRSLAAGVWPT